MPSAPGSNVRLISKWLIVPGQEPTALPALMALANAVQAEPGTLKYLVHTAANVDASLTSSPPTAGCEILFFEEYASPQAFQDHLSGRIFTGFVKEFGRCFVAQANGKPFATCEFFMPYAGFIKPDPQPK